MKLIIILQNILSPYLTKDRIQENIIKVIKLKYENKPEQIYLLDMQNNIGLMDMNAESLDLNRHRLESIPAYIRRVFASEIMTDTNCLGMDEMIPTKY